MQRRYNAAHFNADISLTRSAYGSHFPPLTWNKNTKNTWRKSDSLTVYKCPAAAVATVITVTSTQVIRKVTIINCQI